MIKIVTDKKQIARCHKVFHKQLNSSLQEEIFCTVGNQGGSSEETVRYSTDLDIWIAVYQQHNRFWNAFGVGKPSLVRSNSISVEVNFPFEGNDRRIAGAFGLDEKGNFLALHRGKIGGGRVGIGKSYLIENFRGDTLNGIDGDQETEFYLVGELNSVHFPNQVADFIHEIGRIKNLRNDSNKSDFDEIYNFSYTKEHSGKSVTERTDPVIIDRTHGIVVNALAKKLENQGHKVGNDKNRDLFIHNNNKITTLFEIKTSSSTQCLFSAVGQLIIYSLPVKNDINLVTVLPDKLSKKVEERLLEHGIKVLYYKWSNGSPKFERIYDI